MRWKLAVAILALLAVLVGGAILVYVVIKSDRPQGGFSFDGPGNEAIEPMDNLPEDKTQPHGLESETSGENR